MFEEDFEREHLKDSAYLLEKEMELEMQFRAEMEKQESQNAQIILGKPRKVIKFEKYATVTTGRRNEGCKVPRRINI